MADILNIYSIKLINSVLLTIFTLSIYFLLGFVFNKKIQSPKQLSQAKVRLAYVFIALFMVFFIKIWVAGFIQILAFIGFISAAITITQKDNLMNLVGWLIINWRGLFSEDDYIKIANYNGYVKSIGILYFTLVEANPEFPDSPSGRMIKVPNGLIARNPIVNYSHEKFIECTLNFTFKPRGSFDNLEFLFTSLKEELMNYIKSHTQGCQKITQNLEPKYTIKIRQEKPLGHQMVLMFYCKHFDQTQLQLKVNKMVVDYSHQHEGLTLVFD